MLSHDELAQVSALLHDMLAQHVPFGRDGMVVAGSYDPKDACVDVALLDTMNPVDGDQSGVESRVPLATQHLDDAHGPFGGELVHLVPNQSGYTAHLYRQPGGGEGPQAPAGERWIQLLSPGDHDGKGAQILAYVRLQQNGGHGALALLAGTLFSLMTAGGFGLTLDDVAKKATLVSPGGLEMIFDDNANAIMLGRSGLATADSLVTRTDLQEMADAVLQSVQTGITAPAIPAFTPVVASGSSEIRGIE